MKSDRTSASVVCILQRQMKAVRALGKDFVSFVKASEGC